MQRRLSHIILFLGTPLLFGGLARAHPPGPKNMRPAIGFSLGAGDLDCDGRACDGPQGALGAELHVGPKLGADLSLLGDLWLMTDTAGTDELSQVLLAGAIQWWPVHRFWLRFGVGAAHADFRHEDGNGALVKDAWEPAILTGLGVELVSTPAFALDLQVLYGRGFHRDPDLSLQGLTLGLGMNWY